MARETVEDRKKVVSKRAQLTRDWTVERAVARIATDSLSRGGVARVYTRAFRGNINVTFRDGSWNSYRGDCVDILGWGDENRLYVALCGAFPHADRISIYTVK